MPIIITIKADCHIEGGIDVGHSYKAERPHKNDTKQVIEQQKETDIKREKKSNQALCKQKLLALLKELKVPSLNTPDGSKFEAQLQGETTDWIDQFCSAGSPKLTHTEQMKL